MGLLRFVLREYLHQRHRRRYGGWFGGPPGRYPGPPHDYGYGMWRGRRGGPFDVYRPRPRTRVRGCGCCLPIPLGVLASAGLGLRLRLRAKSR